METRSYFCELRGDYYAPVSAREMSGPMRRGKTDRDRRTGAWHRSISNRQSDPNRAGKR